MMKLLSGHEVSKVTGNERETLRDFKAFADIEILTLSPGNWFYIETFLKVADKAYQFSFKPEDTVVMTYPKSGTTWTQEIVWTIINNPDLDNPEAKLPLKSRTPFLECDMWTHHPYLDQFVVKKGEKNPLYKIFATISSGKNVSDGLIIDMIEAMKGRRTIKTHSPFSLLDPKLIDTCKVVYVARNPMDVCISYFHLSRLFKIFDYHGSIETFVDLFLNDYLVHGPYWAHIKEAWKQRSHPNLHFMYYDDLKADPIQQINLLAKFLGKPLSEKQLQNVVQYTSFASMKDRSKEIAMLPEEVLNTNIAESEDGFFRKGESGEGKKRLPQELQNKIDAWTRENTKDMEDHFKYKL